MIDFDYENKTYICPFCGCKQAINSNSSEEKEIGFQRYFGFGYKDNREDYIKDNDLTVYYILCSNIKCKKMTVVGFNEHNKKQWDIIPENVFKSFPDYIPRQIISDYEEAAMIVEKSPRASATLLRRCLQGMIHDFWKINEKNLNAEITALKGKVSDMQWEAINGLRSIGNIGAHMEKDVNLIIDIDKTEAESLLKLVELLIDKWYIARHDEEIMYSEIKKIAGEKEKLRK